MPSLAADGREDGRFIEAMTRLSVPEDIARLP
jgi:hypothetical protein